MVAALTSANNRTQAALARLEALENDTGSTDMVEINEDDDAFFDEDDEQEGLRVSSAAMPTFTAIAFYRLLEPWSRTQFSKPPPPPVKLVRLTSDKKRFPLPQVSPALYATPATTSFPNSPSSFPPTPYIVNHKRRGPRLLNNLSQRPRLDAAKLEPEAAAGERILDGVHDEKFGVGFDDPGDEVVRAEESAELIGAANGEYLFDLQEEELSTVSNWRWMLSTWKEMDALQSAVPVALGHCVDPPKFAMDAISNVFPVDQWAVKTPTDLDWACVLILESLVPELGVARPLVRRAAKERAREMADAWKKGVEKRGGVEELRPADVHVFLQHLVTFGAVAKEDRELYRKLVLSIAWRRQLL